MSTTSRPAPPPPDSRSHFSTYRRFGRQFSRAHLKIEVFHASRCTSRPHTFAHLSKVTDILDYEMALGAGFEHSQAQQDKVASATGGLLAPRLDRLIRQGCYCMGFYVSSFVLAFSSTGTLS